MRGSTALIALGLLGAAPALAAEAASAPPPPGSHPALIADAKTAMMAEPAQALRHARAAAAVAARIADPHARTLADAEARWLEGESLTRINKPEQAKPVIAAALAAVTRSAPGSKLHGDLLMSQAQIDWMTGRVKEALDAYQTAHGIFAKIGEARAQAKALQAIGSIYFDARDYERMLRYYQQSQDAYAGDPALSISALNNQGDALKELKRFDEAIVRYRRALALAREIESPLLEVRILTNLASARYLAGDLAAADAEANRGLARARGQDTGWEPFLWGVKAQAALARGDLAAARTNVERAFADADLAATTVQFREFHETAFTLYRRLGEEQLALDHLVAFKRLDDEARDVTASTNSALNAARFDFANQELSITKLKAGQLQRDVALERSRARLQKLSLIGALAALAIALLVTAGALFAFFSIRRSRNEVAAANDTLSVTNTALEKALKAKTEFLATTSHEIRTPLNGILGMTQVLLADRRIDRAVRDKVEVVHGAGETMRALVDDILDVAKMETGELTVVDEEVDLSRVLGDAMRLWSGQAERKGLALTLEREPEAPARIRSDEARLRQIIFNLMSNAIKFTEAGAVTVAVSAEPASDGEALVLRVVDTGIGIDATHHEEIFEPFKQVEGGTDRRFGGTGLGLAICRNLSGALGGAITVESRAGEGATFTLRVPLVRVVEVEPEPAVVTHAAAPVSLAEARLLLVEGNPLAQSILRAVLEPAVATLDTVGDGEAAHAAVAAGRADLVLVDAASMAGDDSGPVAALEQLVEAAGASGARVAITFKPSDTLAATMLAHLDARLIGKPVAAPALIAALSALCAAERRDEASAA